MSGSRVLLVVASVLTALLLQTTAIARLSIFGGRPDLVLLVVICFALADGPAEGMLVGFGAGLLTDLLSDHVLGLLALVLCVTGYVVGRVKLLLDRMATVTPILMVAVASAGAVLAAAGIGLLLGDPRVRWDLVARATVLTALYDVVLTPFVFFAVSGLARRTDAGER
jgi:rod shape-determining protein MreD